MTNPPDGVDDDEAAARPWTPAELSAGLQALADRLDTTEDQFAAALEKVSRAVVELRGQPATQQDDTEKRPPRPWTVRATTAQWDELVTWVDWMQANYSTISDYDIPPCWPAHTGIVEELAGLHHAWKRAQLADEAGETTGSIDLTGWHDRSLWPFLHRAKSGHYRTTNCKDRHVYERVTSTPTNRQHLAATALEGDEDLRGAT